MSDMKKKIEKYIQADQMGKESENNDPDILNADDASVKINVDTATEKNRADDPEAGEKDASAPSEKPEDESGDTPEDALKKAQHEAKENHDRYLRLYADFENYKKRTARENDDFRKFANESLIKEILTIVDNLERAVDSSNGPSDEQAPIVEGIQMTLKSIHSMLEKFHVTPIDAVGNPFDPRFHQAFQQEESDEHEENTVLKEFQKGYQLHDRLLRPSMVVVSKKTESA